MIALSIKSPLESESDRFQEDLVVDSWMQTPQLRLSASKVVDLRVQAIASQSSSFNEHNRGVVSIHGVDWHWIEYEILQEEICFRRLMYIAVRNAVVYEIDCTALRVTMDRFRPQFERTIATVHLPRSVGWLQEICDFFEPTDDPAAQ